MKIVTDHRETLPAALVLYKETRQRVRQIRNDEKFNHSNILGGIDWGSNSINTSILFKLDFEPLTTGCIYSISTPRDTMQQTSYKNYAIQYNSLLIDHISGYRYSNAKKFISELWLRIITTPLNQKSNSQTLLTPEQCMFERSRFIFRGLGLEGMLFQLSPYGTPQLYIFDSKEIYKQVLRQIKKVEKSLTKIVPPMKVAWIPTDKVPFPP